jgi:hypothetical protein
MPNFALDKKQVKSSDYSDTLLSLGIFYLSVAPMGNKDDFPCFVSTIYKILMP